jgi:hypothetical protein
MRHGVLKEISQGFLTLWLIIIILSGKTKEVFCVRIAGFEKQARGALKEWL